jgi:hypothetical protein
LLQLIMFVNYVQAFVPQISLFHLDAFLLLFSFIY